MPTESGTSWYWPSVASPVPQLSLVHEHTYTHTSIHVDTHTIMAHRKIWNIYPTSSDTKARGAQEHPLVKLMTSLNRAKNSIRRITKCSQPANIYFFVLILNQNLTLLKWQKDQQILHFYSFQAARVSNKT